MMRYLWIFDIGIRESNEFRPGWSDHMFPLAFAGASIPFCLLFGIDWLLLLVLVSAIFLVCSRKLIARSVRRIRRMGWFAPTRGRWWIELAALDWTLCMAGGCFWLASVLQGGGPLCGNGAVAVVGDLTRLAFYAFYPLAAAGYVIGLCRGRRTAGGSLETVNHFFWMSTVIWLLKQGPPLGAWFAPVMFGIAAGAAMLAGVLFVRARRMNRKLASLDAP